MNDVSMIFRALADETRLQMIALILKHRELCVCDFVHVLAITQSKASRHLRYLAHAGLLADRREAIWIHYRLADDLSPEHHRILESARNLVDPKRLAELEARLSGWLKEKGCASSRTVASAELEPTEVHA
jgi:ArsR family transcriptional regulator